MNIQTTIEDRVLSTRSVIKYFFFEIEKPVVIVDRAVEVVDGFEMFTSVFFSIHFFILEIKVLY